MNATLYKCLRMNWLRGMYEWETFAARDDAEAHRIVSRGGYLPESLAPTYEMHPVA